MNRRLSDYPPEQHPAIRGKVLWLRSYINATGDADSEQALTVKKEIAAFEERRAEEAAYVHLVLRRPLE